MSLATESVTPTVSSMPNTFPRGELSRVVRLVALLNLGYFGVEFAVASPCKDVCSLGANARVGTGCGRTFAGIAE